MSGIILTIDWRKLPSDPLTHDQWEAIGVDALIRKNNEFEFSAYYKTKLVGDAFPNLRTAKVAIERRFQSGGTR